MSHLRGAPELDPDGQDTECDEMDGLDGLLHEHEEDSADREARPLLKRARVGDDRDRRDEQWSRHGCQDAATAAAARASTRTAHGTFIVSSSSSSSSLGGHGGETDETTLIEEQQRAVSLFSRQTIPATSREPEHEDADEDAELPELSETQDRDDDDDPSEQQELEQRAMLDSSPSQNIQVVSDSPVVAAVQPEMPTSSAPRRHPLVVFGLSTQPGEPEPPVAVVNRSRREMGRPGSPPSAAALADEDSAVFHTPVAVRRREHTLRNSLAAGEPDSAAHFRSPAAHVSSPIRRTTATDAAAVHPPGIDFVMQLEQQDPPIQPSPARSSDDFQSPIAAMKRPHAQAFAAVPTRPKPAEAARLSPVPHGNSNLAELVQESQTCSICFESWSNSGLHRIVALKCGHLFGKNCIETWLKSAEKCPECNGRAKKADVRILIAKTLIAIDTTERDRALRHLEDERKERTRAQQSEARATVQSAMFRAEVERLGKLVSAQREREEELLRRIAALQSQGGQALSHDAAALGTSSTPVRSLFSRCAPVIAATTPVQESSSSSISSSISKATVDGSWTPGRVSSSSVGEAALAFGTAEVVVSKCLAAPPSVQSTAIPPPELAETTEKAADDFDEFDVEPGTDALFSRALDDVTAPKATAALQQSSRSHAADSMAAPPPLNNPPPAGFQYKTTIPVCKNGSGRIAGFDSVNGVLGISKQGNPPFGPGHGILKLSTIDMTFSHSEFVGIHNDTIRDFKFSERPNSLVLTASADKTVKLSSLKTNSVVLTYQVNGPAWACAWNTDVEHILYAGLQSGSTLVFDIRNTRGPVSSFSPSKVPIISLHYSSAKNGLTHTTEGASVDHALPSSLLIGTLRGPWICDMPLDASRASESDGGQLQARPALSEGDLSGSACSWSYVHRETRTWLASLRPSADPTLPRLQLRAGAKQVLLSRSTLLPHPAFSGLLLVAAGDEATGQVDLWNATTGERVQTIQARGFAGPVLDVCHFQDSRAHRDALMTLTAKEAHVFVWKR
ncbi:RFWD3 protein [Capsaspora owczarzaki ATCC 30864]|uniref:RFWD3 protein n=1 Tax=Capsaspora owczarzaki (strain ATCC 30864) TaxID=595528 RepID=UPI0001FE3684|nr:RFWD3 protein [Capsaspora owczarzaki ATCC 30864]|eukprot:XP_004365112.1 RFWD3 protein [Capsaspora owczarzaki ATCC 30864]